MAKDCLYDVFLSRSSKTSVRAATERLRAWLLCALLLASCLVSSGQTRVEDIFGRALNQHGLRLVDWDGYMANPLIKFFLLPPTNAVFPGSASLTANGARLYFDSPGNISTGGPTKTVSLANAATRQPVRISIFPDRDGLDEDYTLTIVFTDANSAKQTNRLPIHIIDQDLTRTNEFAVIVNFDRDITGFFTNATRRALGAAHRSLTIRRPSIPVVRALHLMAIAGVEELGELVAAP